MKKVLSFVSGIAVCTGVALAQAESTTVSLAGGNFVEVDILSRSAESVRARITLHSPSRVTSAIVAEVKAGEVTEYYLETLAKSASVDLLAQCPDITPSVSLGSIRFGWSKDSGVGFTVSSANGSSFSYACAANTCTTVTDSVLDDDSLQLASSGEEEALFGLCLPETVSSSPDSSVSSILDERLPTIDPVLCSAALTDACIEPSIINSIITIASDSGPKETNRSLDQDIQRKRRLLARALKSNHAPTLSNAVASVRRLVREVTGKGIVSASTAPILSKVLTLLDDRGKSQVRAIKRAVQLLKRIKSA